jgi:hypothetical protein
VVAMLCKPFSARLGVWCALVLGPLASGCADNEVSAVAPDDPVVQDDGGCSQGTTLCGSACFDLQSDPMHCATCDHECPAGNTCFIGLCTGSCDGGLTSCFGNCVDTSKDNANCGSCANQCSSGAMCIIGECQCGPPGSPLLYCYENDKCVSPGCPKKCVNKNLDFMNCGQCGHRCQAPHPCVNGVCQP